MIYDVIMMGGGLAGKALALQIQRQIPNFRVLVLEKGCFPAPEAAYKIGESTVELTSFFLSTVLGLKDHLQTAHLNKLGTRFFFGAERVDDISQAFEFGVAHELPVLTYQLDRGRLENHLVQLLQQPQVDFQSGARVTSFEIGAGDEIHQVTYQQGKKQHQVQGRWLIDAAGRAALIKRRLKLQEKTRHAANAVWFRLDHQIKLDNWSMDLQWQERVPGRRRWLSTNHLMGEGYWVWIIPLASGATSVGIVADPTYHPLDDFNSFSKAMQWLQRHQPLCAQQLEPHRDKLMDFGALKHFSHSCKKLFSADRWAITGDAGLFADPFYSPGNDFIAMSNAFIMRLLELDSKGRPSGAQAEIFDGILRSFFERLMLLYTDQYHNFGNPRVMTLKIIWDFALYWSFLAFFYTQTRMVQPFVYSRLRPHIGKMSDLNQRVQEFFRTWPQCDSAPQAGYLDQAQPFLRQLNGGLLAFSEDEQTFDRRFEAHIAQLGRLTDEIAALHRGEVLSSDALLKAASESWETT